MPRKKKDPDMPKRPLSSYMFYSKERRPLLQEEQPNLQFGEYSKLIAAEWKTMEGEAKQKYLDLSKEDKDRYEEQLKVYKEKKKNEPPPPMMYQDMEHLHQNFTTQDHINHHRFQQQQARERQYLRQNPHLAQDYQYQQYVLKQQQQQRMMAQRQFGYIPQDNFQPYLHPNYYSQQQGYQQPSQYRQQPSQTNSQGQSQFDKENGSAGNAKRDFQSPNGSGSDQRPPYPSHFQHQQQPQGNYGFYQNVNFQHMPMHHPNAQSMGFDQRNMFQYGTSADAHGHGHDSENETNSPKANKNPNQNQSQNQNHALMMHQQQQQQQQREMMMSHQQQMQMQHQREMLHQQSANAGRRPSQVLNLNSMQQQQLQSNLGTSSNPNSHLQAMSGMQSQHQPFSSKNKLNAPPKSSEPPPGPPEPEDQDDENDDEDNDIQDDDEDNEANDEDEDGDGDEGEVERGDFRNVLVVNGPHKGERGNYRADDGSNAVVELNSGQTVLLEHSNLKVAQ